MEFEEIVIGKYTVRLVKKDGELIGAIIHGPRLARTLYVGKEERVKLPQLPKPVKKFLMKNNFKVE